MEITLKNYTTSLPKTLQKQAEKTAVRECDETSKGQFVAYVDEGEATFDVALHLSAKGVVEMHSCDCEAAVPFCKHKSALLLHIAQGARVKAAVKGKKKESKTETLLEETDSDSLKAWLLGVLQKNKDLELSFVHYFSARQQTYTPEAILKLTTDAIKAVGGYKKNVDTTQLKKLVELWEGIHAPVVAQYVAAAGDKVGFQNLHTVVDACLLYNEGINTNSNKVPRYVEGLLRQTVEPINNLFDEAVWEEAVDYFVIHLHEGHRLRLHYLNHLKEVLSISAGGRRKRLLEKLAVQYKKSDPTGLVEGARYTKMLFDIMQEEGVLADYAHLFKPIHFDNEFNRRLIQLLIDKSQLAQAEEYCRGQMAGNYREEYNLPYLKLLKQIYTLQNNEEGMAEVVAALLPQTFEFDDYLFVSARLGEEERKKWRTKIMAKARNQAQSYNEAAAAFYFALLHHEKAWRKMVDSIDSATPYAVILKYFEPMAQAESDRLLKTLLQHRDFYLWGLATARIEEDKACLLALYAKAVKLYGEDRLRQSISEAKRSVTYFHPSELVKYFERRLFFTA